MDRSRLVLVSLVCFVLPVVLLTLTLTLDDASVSAWLVAIGVVLLAYAALSMIVVVSGQSGARAVEATKTAMPDALIVCRAIDERIRPRGVRLFVADGDGVMMCDGRGARLKPRWTLPWEQVSSASVTMATFRTGRKHALAIRSASGELRTLGLVSAYGVANPADVAERAAQLINTRRVRGHLHED